MLNNANVKKYNELVEKFESRNFYNDFLAQDRIFQFETFKLRKSNSAEELLDKITIDVVVDCNEDEKPTAYIALPVPSDDIFFSSNEIEIAVAVKETDTGSILLSNIAKAINDYYEKNKTRSQEIEIVENYPDELTLNSFYKRVCG